MKINQEVLEVLKKVPPCCLYCKNTYRANRVFTGVELLRIERGEVDADELLMRADLPYEDAQLLHCDLFLRFVNKKDCCESFEYRCSIVHQGYLVQETEKEKRKLDSIGVQLKLF